MHTMKFIALYFVVSVPLVANAASSHIVQNERNIREECSAYSQAGMRDCLSKKAKESEKVLKQTEDKVINILSKWDEDSKFASIAKTKLATSSKEFARYRESQCAFSTSLGGGAIGNALEIRRLSCVAEINNLRTEQLRNAIIDLPLR